MPVSLVLTLGSERALALPAHLGRASHSALLRLVGEADAALADALHEPNQRRPFTCSTLWGPPKRSGRLRMGPEQPARVRYTSLCAELDALLLALAERPPAALEIDGEPLTVLTATADPADDEWAGVTDYETLAANCLLPGEAPPARATLDFASPTGFRSSGQVVPLPLPDLVYGSLLDKWNAFAPLALPDEMRRFGAECVAVSRYRLRTRAVRAKGRSLQIGFVGQCSFTALNRDRYWVSVLQLLTDFAFYAGVGYQTTVGLGQARRAP
jgi:CRISPR-associated endoribonuclease Cas6